MATVTQLRELENAETARILVIEGLDSWFVDNEELSGSVGIVGSWQYQNRQWTDADCTASLMTPDSTKVEIDLREARIKNTTSNFVLKDIDGEIAHLFAPERDGVTSLKTTINPGELADNAFDQQGVSVVSKHVGLEKIGASGERHRNPCVMDFQPGLFHPGHLSIPGQASIPVCSEPTLFAGRRYCLYETYRDIVTYPNTRGGHTWRPISEAIRVHWGTLRDSGVQHKKDWTISTFGPASWLQKRLNYMTPQNDIPLIASASLTPDERQIAVCFETLQYHSGLEEWTRFHFASGTFDENDLIGDTDSDLVENLVSLVNTLKNEDQGKSWPEINETVWSDHRGQQFEVDPDAKIKVRIDAVDPLGMDRATRCGIVRICLHEKNWNRLGYDMNQELYERDDEKYVSFRELPWHPNEGGGFSVGPTQGEEIYPIIDRYFEGRFSTVPLGYDQIYWGPEVDLSADPYWRLIENGGSFRHFQPVIQWGAHTLYADLNDGDGQVVYLDQNEFIYHHGQRWRPPAGDPNDPTAPYSLPGITADGGGCNATGLWVIHGPRRIKGEEDPKDEVQVARISWHTGSAGDGLMSYDDTTGNNVAVITHWEDPQDYGFKNKRLDSDWLGRNVSIEEGDTIQAVPLSIWKYKRSVKDLAYKVAQRLILTTGTSGSWDSYEGDPNATQTPGWNNVDDPGDPGSVFDAERPEFGLSIPNEMVVPPATWRAEADMWGPGIDRTNYYNIGMITGEEILRSIFNVRGWVWSLDGSDQTGKYGPLNIFHVVDPSQTTVTLAAADIIGTPETPRFGWPFQDIRALAPIDGADLDCMYNPLEKSMEQKYTVDSTDYGARYRVGDNRVDLSDRGLKDVGTGFHEMWGGTAANFWAMRHMIVTIRVHRTKGNKLWPGTKVMISDPRIVSQAGIYGITNFSGLVISTNRKYKKAYTEIQVLVYANNTDWRYYAPSCEGIGYDSDNDRIYCKDNWLNLVGRPPGINTDVGMFTEPSWLDGFYGGQAEVSVYQKDREVWVERDTVAVTAVNDVVGSAYLELAKSISYMRDQDTIIVMREISNQSAAWVVNLYAPTTNENGVVTGGDSVKFIDK